MKKSMIKLLVLLIVLCLSVGILFAGCKGDTQETTPTVTTTVPNTQPTEPEPTETEPEIIEEWNGFWASCFTGGLKDYTGEIDGVTFQGLLMDQPQTATLTKAAVKALRLYARENGYDGLRVHTYVNQKDNTFTVNGVQMDHGSWSFTDIYLGYLNSLTQFTSNSTGETENYMWFEFIQMPAINETSFEGPVSPFKGTIGGVTFDGFVFKSVEYQPTVYFNAESIEDIKAYAEANGFNALRISCYPIQKDNSFMVGGYSYGLDSWTTKDFDVTKLSTEFAFWSQSQGVTENYMIFEFVNSSNPLRPYGKEGPPTPSSPYFNANNQFSVETYKGTVSEVKFDGYLFKSSHYQPSFYFSNAGISAVKKAAEKHNMNFLRIHVYPILLDNGFAINGEHCANNAWTTVDIPVAQLSTNIQFWSQSQGTTEVYLWFEMYSLDIPEKGLIDSTFFQAGNNELGSPAILSFSDYAGEVDGQVINGIKIVSADYQPHFHLTEDAIAAIKAYGEENGYNFLNIHSYSILFDNNLIIGDTSTNCKEWTTVQISLDSLNAPYQFWSQSQGLTEIYMWFSWEHMDIPEKGFIDSTFFEAGNNELGSIANLTFSDYAGEVDGKIINGINIKSADYQPHFRFTEDGLSAIKAYALENDVDTLRIYAYGDVFDNTFALNNQQWSYKEWKMLEVDIPSLTTSFDFWSQSQGYSNLYLTFEFFKSPLIGPASFSGAFSFESFEGEVGGKQIVGIKATSSVYQPHFNFSEGGINKLKAYAAANDVNVLRIHAYAIVTDNNFVIDNQWYVPAEWKQIDVSIGDLSTEYDFWSQSQGTSEIYLAFEFYKAEMINPTIFTGSGFSFEDFSGTIDDVTFTGIKATSSSYQPSFYFTDNAVKDFKAYAAENGYNYVTIHLNAKLTNNAPCINGAWLGANEWTQMDVPVSSLSTSFQFWSASEGTTEMYLWFEFYRYEVITTESFGGAFIYEDFAGTIEGKDISGIKLTSTGRQRDAFTAEAIEQIKAYAEASGFTTLKIQVYVTLDNNAFTVFGQAVAKDQWNEISVSIDSLTTSSRIQTTCTGNTEAYFVFDFA